MKAAQISEYGSIDKIEIKEVDKPKVEPGKVLIHGGAGGIGMAAIQMAKHIGACSYNCHHRGFGIC